MTAPKDRAELIELMARTHHNANLGHIVKWEDKTDRSFSLILAALVLDAIEARGCAVVPVEALTEAMQDIEDGAPDDAWRVLKHASTYRKEPQP